jgi:predicted Zn-dependent protease
MALDLPKLRKLVSLDEKDPLSRFALGKKLFETGELEEAVEHLRFANAAAPQHLATYHILSQALIQLGKTDEARRVLQAGIPRVQSVGEGMGRDLGPAMSKLLQQIDSTGPS